MEPAFGGTTGLIYNPDKVPGGVSSFEQLMEDPALEGKVAIEDNPKYGIAMAALALGFKDPYDLTDADLAQVKQWYIEHKSQIRAFYSDESDFFDLYQRGDVVAGFGYKGYDVGLAKQGATVTFAPASEGALTWTCGYSIGANATNLDGAYALLAWFLDPGGAIRLRDEVEPDGHEQGDDRRTAAIGGRGDRDVRPLPARYLHPDGGSSELRPVAGGLATDHVGVSRLGRRQIVEVDVHVRELGEADQPARFSERGDHRVGARPWGG